MRKEVLVAIILGVGLGALVAFGIWRANLAFSPKKEAMETPGIETSATPEPMQNTDLIITQPEESSVVNTDKVTIKGSATPRSTVVVITAVDQSISEADQDGSFQQDVTLDSGPNEVKIVSYDPSGNESSQTLNLVYSTQFPGNQ